MYTVVRHIVFVLLLSISSWVNRIEHELSGQRDVSSNVCYGNKPCAANYHTHIIYPCLIY